MSQWWASTHRWVRLILRLQYEEIYLIINFGLVVSMTALVWLGSGLGYRAVSWLADKRRRSVSLNSNTRQSVLASGSRPAQWQRRLINAIIRLSSDSHHLLCLDLHIPSALQQWNECIRCAFRIPQERLDGRLDTARRHTASAKKSDKADLFFPPNNL